MQIDLLDAWTSELDAIAGSSTNATFYHTETWLRSLADAYPRMSLRVLVAHESGNPRAFLPFFESRRGFLRVFWSLPFGTYGGPVGEGEVGAQLMKDYHDRLSTPGVMEVGCVDYSNSLDEEGWERTALSTHVVDISGGFDDVWRNRFDKPRRRRARRAEENGVTVRRGNGEADVARFMEVYRERLDDWKTGRGHPEELFHALARRGGDRVRLYLAEHEGAVIGGHFNFYHGEGVIAWYGMTSSRAGETQAGTLLYMVCMRDACNDGFRSYNLGASLGKRSLIDYKQSLGGVLHPYRMLRRRRFGVGFAARVRRGVRRT